MGGRPQGCAGRLDSERGRFFGPQPRDLRTVWLLPLVPRLARTAAFVYYRVRYRGSDIPSSGPALLVANHPNSLLDPMLVAAAARRPLRFLAKAPLFSDAKIGWLIRASGSIPVYRRSDDPAQVQRNEEMFRAVHQALAAGDAVAVFPEGISHSEPSMAPLRTGAARIALGAAAVAGGPIPVIPVGLVFRRKDQFRSEALVVVGQPVAWGDLADRGAEDGEAVRTLTERISGALRALTINLDAWHDAPLVECATAIWEAELAVTPDDAARVTRQALTATILAKVRAEEDAEGLVLADAVDAHRRRLARLGLRPNDLRADLGTWRALRWTTARVPLLMPLAAALAAAGWLLFLVPYRLTGVLVHRFPLKSDTRSTWKLMVGTVIYATWLLVLGILAWRQAGGWAAMLVCLVAPVIGMSGLLVRERWRGAWQDARRWLLLRSRRPLIDGLRETQCDLGARLDRLQQRLAT
jgi:glycerol-3-phosphate O-acyltransferase/dihydroxyacetone phosphate acyltransferase